MRYVEPFTQRASLTNLELAEPIEIGGGPQTSRSESLEHSDFEEAQNQNQRQSPIKESIIGQPSAGISRLSRRRQGFN